MSLNGTYAELWNMQLKSVKGGVDEEDRAGRDRAGNLPAAAGNLLSRASVQAQVLPPSSAARLPPALPNTRSHPAAP